MKEIMSKWKKYLNEVPLAEAKVYSLGDEYAISFHPDNIIYITQRGGHKQKKKWYIQPDDESYKYLKNVLLKSDPYQIEVTRDELLRGRYGKLIVIAHNPHEKDEKEIETIDDITFDF